MGFMKDKTIRGPSYRGLYGFRIGADTFFDRKPVQNAMDKATRQALQAIGKDLRKDARNSMRRRKKPALPGQPPHVKTRNAANPSGGGLRRAIMYGYDAATQSVVVGPSPVVGANILGFAALHEFGGPQRIRNKRRVRRYRGDGGEISISRRRRPGSKRVKDWRGKRHWVNYAILRSSAQARRANRLNRQIYGKLRYTAHYPKRPFMGPSLRRRLRTFPKHWKGRVK